MGPRILIVVLALLGWLAPSARRVPCRQVALAGRGGTHMPPTWVARYCCGSSAADLTTTTPLSVRRMGKGVGNDDGVEDS